MSSNGTLPKERRVKQKPAYETTPQSDMDEATLWEDFIKLLESIDTETSVAKLNETSIADESGERIEL